MVNFEDDVNVFNYNLFNKEKLTERPKNVFILYNTEKDKLTIKRIPFEKIDFYCNDWDWDGIILAIDRNFTKMLKKADETIKAGKAKGFSFTKAKMTLEL